MASSWDSDDYELGATASYREDAVWSARGQLGFQRGASEVQRGILGATAKLSSRTASLAQVVLSSVCFSNSSSSLFNGAFLSNND